MVVKNKRILKEISKRYAKSILVHPVQEAFDNLGLTEEESKFISDEVKKNRQ